MALTIYDNAIPRVNGRHLTEATEVSIDYISGDEVIHLLAGGTKRTMVVSPGARALRISWSVCVPTNDSADLKLIRKWRDAEEVRVGVDFRGSKLGISTKGFLQDPKLTGKVGSAFQYSLTAICEVVDFG